MLRKSSLKGRKIQWGKSKIPIRCVKLPKGVSGKFTTSPESIQVSDKANDYESARILIHEMIHLVWDKKAIERKISKALDSSDVLDRVEEIVAWELEDGIARLVRENPVLWAWILMSLAFEGR